MADKTVQVTLRANVSSYLSSMRQAAGATAGFSSGTQRDLTKLGGTMQSVGKAATIGISVPLVGLGAVATKMAGDFDSAFTRMQSLAGVSAGEIDGLKASVLDLAGETGRAPAELAEALYFLRSSGLDAAEAVDALNVSAKASAAGMGDTATIADAVSSAMNAYGSETLSAADASDVLLGTIREGKGEPEELAAAIGRVIAPAETLGVSFDQVGAALASMTLVGLDAAEATTALRGILMALQNPTKEQADALADMGLSLQTVRDVVANQGLLPALTMLANGVGDNEEAMSALFGNVRALNGVLTLTGENSENTARIFDSLKDSAGATDAAFATWAESMGAKNAKAFAEFQTAMITAGETILPIVTSIVGGAADIASAFSDLPGPMQSAVLALGGLLILAGPVTTFAGTVVRNLATVGAALDVMTAKATVASGAMTGLFIGGLLALDLARPREELVKTAEGFERVEQKGEGMGETLKNIFTGDFSFKDTFGEAVIPLSAAEQGISNVGAATTNLGSSIEATGFSWDSFIQRSETAEDKTRELIGTIGDAGAAGDAFSAVMSVVAAAEQMAADAAAEAREAIRDLRVEVLAGLDNAFSYEESQLALADSLADLEKATGEYNTKAAEGTFEAGEQAQALRDLRGSQIDAAKTALASAFAFAEQAGAAEGSRRHVNLVTGELQRLAAENPAIQAEVQRFIDKLNAIPAKKRPKVELDKKQADKDADDTKRKIEDIPDRNVKIDADNSDAMAAANAVIDVLNSIHDKNVTITSTVRTNQIAAQHGHHATRETVALVGEAGPELVTLPTGATVHPHGRSMAMLSQMGVPSFQAGGRVRGGPRPPAGFEDASPRVNRILREAAALIKLAAAEKDAEKAADLRATAADKMEKAADLHAMSIGRSADQLQREAEVLRDNADALREDAKAAIEAGNARREALVEQTTAFRGAFDAQLDLNKAERVALDAAAEATTAHRTFGLSARERAEADEAAQEAALNLADAQLQLARQQAARRGGTLTAEQELAIFQRSLREQAGDASPELRGVFASLISSLNIPQQARLLERGREAIAAGREEAVALRRAAGRTDAASRELAASARAFDRVARRLDNVKWGRPINVIVQQKLTRKEIEEALREIAA